MKKTKITILKKNFKFFKSAASIISYSSSTLAASTIWLTAIDKDTIKISVNNGIEYTCAVPAEVETNSYDFIIGLQCILLNKLLSGIVSDVTIVCDDGEATLKHKNGKIKLPMVNTNCYVANDEEPEKGYMVEDLKQYINNVQHCVDEYDDSELACIYINNEIDTVFPYIAMCGLDGHKFARQLFTLENEEKLDCDEKGLRINRKFFSYIIKHTQDDQARISYSDKRIFFRNRDKEVLSVPRIIEGQFPDYRLFLSKFKTEGFDVNVARYSIQSALERARIISEGSSVSVHITIKDKVLTFSIQNTDAKKNNGCSTEENIDVDYSGLFDIFFNVNSLYSIISHFPDTFNLTFRFTTKEGPCMITATATDGTYEAVIMPTVEVKKVDEVFTD